MEYKEYKPHPLLASFVECYWSAYSQKPPFREKESLIPDGSIELMFNFGDNYAELQHGQKKIVKGSHVIGIRKQSLHISQTNKQHFFSIRFKLGGTYPFFNIPTNLFAGAFFEVDTLLGRDYLLLEEQLWESPTNEKRVEIAELFLLKRLHSHAKDYDFVSRCSGMLLANNHPSVQALAKDAGTNYKALERKFKKVLGLTPAELIKIKRFNKAVLSMYACRHSSLTGIAYESGYYDQSHFIREFKQLAHYTPREFLKEQFTIVQVIQPALADRMSKSYNL